MKKLNREKGQMLLLTGIITIVLFIACAAISTDLSNINIKTSSDESHPLYLEYTMVREKFINAMDTNEVLTEEDFDIIRERFVVIEAKHNINFNAILDKSTTPNPITIELYDDDTTIIETFVSDLTIIALLLFLDQELNLQMNLSLLL